MNVVTVHYNTPQLTEAMIMSLNRQTPGCKVYVFDNSDRRPFLADIPNVEVLDNTKGQIIDLDAWLDTFPNKVKPLTLLDNYGSARHTKSVDMCFDLIPDGFILLDSDVLVRRDISAFWDKECATAGEINKSRKHEVNIPRLWPFICYLNVPMLKEYGIRYCNEEKMWFLNDKLPDMYYDTGAWVLEECSRLGLLHNEMLTRAYIVHYGRGSKRQDFEDNETEWLKKHEDLWRY